MTDDGSDLIGRVFHVRNFEFDVRIYSRSKDHKKPSLVAEWDNGKPPETVRVVNARQWIESGDWYE